MKFSKGFIKKNMTLNVIVLTKNKFDPRSRPASNISKGNLTVPKR